MDIATHPVVRDPLPLQAREALAGKRVQIAKQMREGAARRLLHREHLHAVLADLQVVAVALDRRIRDEIIQMGVVREVRGVHDRGVIVHELSEEPEGLRLGQPLQDNVAQLHVQGARLVMERGDGAIEFRLKEGDRLSSREPLPDRLRRPPPEILQGGAGADGRGRLVQHDEVARELVQLRPSTIEVRRALLNRLVRHRSRTRRCHNRIDRPFHEVLVQAIALVEQAERRLKAMDDRITLAVRQPFTIDPANPVDDADMSSLRQERRLIDEPPKGKQSIEAAGFLIVAEDAREPHHGVTSTTTD